MDQEAILQYASALKAGQRYYKEAVAAGESPYPAVLDELVDEAGLAGRVNLGLTDIPIDLIVGTRSAGRTAALAGNFMPLLEANSEFGGKWIRLCAAHLSEGIREPIQALEYLGKFYVQEGNKRVSVLKSFDAPSISATVTRLLPVRSEDEQIRVYYEFTDFNALSGVWGLNLSKPGAYARLQAALGVEQDHVWTDSERRSFKAGFSRFSASFEKLGASRPELSPGDALLVWLQLYPFSDLKELSAGELDKRLKTLWPDVLAQSEDKPITVSTLPEEKEQGVLSRLLDKVTGNRLRIAYIYAYAPELSPWTRAHDLGRQELEKALGGQISVKVYRAEDHDYLRAMEQAADEGAELIFATTPAMIGACRKLAAAHKELKILNCALSQPYTGVRMYYSRIYECKFITGAIAGIMSPGDEVGYVANYPIYGVPTAINAFALGLRMTKPKGRVLLDWSCTRGDPVRSLLDRGVTVISNREAVSAEEKRHPLSLGTYIRREDGRFQTLATPRWDWGKLYEKIVKGVLGGAWEDISRDEAVNYWWGMDSGVIDVTLGEELPDGVRSLAELLRRELRRGDLHPFRTRILDQQGLLRCDGSRDLSPEELMGMDWLCDNVVGSIPAYEELLPVSREMARLLGLYRDSLPPEKEVPQL